MTYGKRLNEALHKADKMRKHLALELGVTPQAIGMVITGGGLAERKLSFENNQKAARFLRVNELWLWNDDGMPDAAEPTIIPYIGPSSLGRELALVFDMIPESNALKRAKAYALASSAIVAILQDEAVTLARVPGK